MKVAIDIDTRISEKLETYPILYRLVKDTTLMGSIEVLCSINMKY